MSRKITFLVAPILLLLCGASGYAQDPSQDQPQPSLGDIARAARKDKEKNATKPKTVITDDNLPSSNGLNGLADVGNSQASGDAMTKAAARLEEAETGLKKLATLDRATLARVVLLDNDVDFPDRRNWEEKLYAAKEHYVSREGELIVELRQTIGQVQSWKASHSGQSKLDPGDPQAQQLKQRLMEIVQDAVRTEQTYRAVVMEGWDLAKQAKH